MKYTFPEGFKLGATGAGWQMEGETDKRPDQKHFPHLMWENDRENWYLGLGPDVASDFYGHFREDIPMFRKAGILLFLDIYVLHYEGLDGQGLSCLFNEGVYNIFFFFKQKTAYEIGQ